MKVVTFGSSLLIILCIRFTTSELINWKDYVNQIAKNVIHLLEAKQITGDGMPLWDFENTINKSLYGIRAEGTVQFHSGFVAKIREATIKNTTYRSANSDVQSTIYAQLALIGMELFYDVRYKLSEYNANGTLLLWLPETLFDLNIRRDHRSKATVASLAFISTGNQNLMKVQVHPDNGWTQLTARELKQVSTFRRNMTDAFNTWNVVWQQLLDETMTKFEFPPMCYYCP